MPLYEYQCDACGRRFEKIQKFSDQPLESCELCGKGPVHKLLSSPAIQFKGSGWYITDYAKKAPASTGDRGTAADPAKPESDSKPAEKSEKSDKSAAPAAKADSPAKSSS